MSAAKSSKPTKAAKSAKADAGPRLIAENRKARFDFYIEDRFEAGIVLVGWEVKSLREAKANLKESYAIFRGDELWLIGAHITPIVCCNVDGTDKNLVNVGNQRMIYWSNEIHRGVT